MPHPRLSCPQCNDSQESLPTSSPFRLINQLHGTKYFTKMDVRWGYQNVQIKEGDKWKAAFWTSHRLFEPLVMFFGLTNSPSTFQTMMNEIFQDLIMEGVVCVYLNDILIYTKTMEEHYRIIQMQIWVHTNRIPWTHSHAQVDCNGCNQSHRSHRMACAQDQERGAVIPWVCKLLL